MSHLQNTQFAESVNEARQEEGLRPLTFSQAIELAFSNMFEKEYETPYQFMENYIN